MHRIIKRTITIVTTVTWTISWRPKEAMPINVEVQPAADIPELLVLPEGESGSWEIEATISKGVEVSEKQTTNQPQVDQPPDHLYHQNLERKEIKS